MDQKTHQCFIDSLIVYCEYLGWLAVQEMIDYNAGSSVRLSRGLYLGYLKLGSSLDQILVMAVQNRPNTLPNVKIRDNSHVSRQVSINAQENQMCNVIHSFRAFI